MMDVKKISVAELFSRFHVTLKEAWLNEVLEYLRMERDDADIPTVIQLVYEQWLYSELSNSTRPKIRLPPFEKKTSLDSDVVVQINWLVDIRTSMYSKLNKYIGRNVYNSFFDWETNDGKEDLGAANRMCLMEITDGQRKLRAIEYQKIDKLCEKLSCGAKLLIYGGTICRRNVLLLTPNNMMILGGESEICQQNIPALVMAQRLGIDERNVKSEEYENSVKTVEVTGKKEMEKVQVAVPSLVMRQNFANNLNAQQNKTMCTSKTIKGENMKKKKQKKSVFSRTITSYFQPQQKIPTPEISPKISVKSQMPLIGQKIKDESGYLPLDQFRKQREMEPLSLLLPNSKQESQYPTSTTAFPQESNQSSVHQSCPSVVSSQMLCTQNIISHSGMGSKITGKLITTEHCQSQSVRGLSASSQFRIQSENASLSTKLRNFGTTRSLVSEGESRTFPARKRCDMRNAVILNEDERRQKVAKSLIPVWPTDFQQKSADAILHAAVISSKIQEPTIWTANKWRQAINEDSKQFLAKKFRVPTSEVMFLEAHKYLMIESDMINMEVETVDNNNALFIHSPSIHGPLGPLQNSSAKGANDMTIARTSFDLQGKKVVKTPDVAFQSDIASFRSGILFPKSVQNFWKLPVTNFQSSKRNLVPFLSSQNSFKSSELQQISRKSMYHNTSLKNRPTTLVLPNAKLQVVPHVNIVERYRALNIISIREAYHQRKYCLVVHRKRVQPIFCKLHAGLQFIGQSWTAMLRIADETCDALDCLVDNSAIHDLIGFTPQEAQQAAAINDRVRISYYKGRAEAMLETFKRSDLVLTIEFSSSSDVLPLIVGITNLSTTLGLC
ncbi:RecQ-mediated genome instability protein [Dirofilaria immitis]